MSEPTQGLDIDMPSTEPLLRQVASDTPVTQSKTEPSGWVSVCMECWQPTSHDTFDMDCHTCEHCGDHCHGARQQQLDKPCTKPEPTIDPSWQYRLPERYRDR